MENTTAKLISWFLGPTWPGSGRNFKAGLPIEFEKEFKVKAHYHQQSNESPHSEVGQVEKKNISIRMHFSQNLFFLNFSSS